MVSDQRRTTCLLRVDAYPSASTRPPPTGSPDRGQSSPDRATRLPDLLVEVVPHADGGALGDEHIEKTLQLLAGQHCSYADATGAPRLQHCPAVDPPPPGRTRQPGALLLETGPQLPDGAGVVRVSGPEGEQ